MAEHPILFRADMARAILEGRKTQTRRRGLDRLARIKVGDTLWVREPIRRYEDFGDEFPRVAYEADGAVHGDAEWVWQRDRLPSIHMPYGLCRLRLRVTGVRTQLVGNISHEGAIAEGFDSIGGFLEVWYAMHPKSRINERIVVIEFERKGDA